MTYQEKEIIWKSLWQKVMESTGQTAYWNTPWVQPTGDGNPIFSAIRICRGMTVRIIDRDESDEIDYSSWVGVYAAGHPEEAKELVIYSKMNQLDLAEKKLLDWVKNGPNNF